MTLATPLVTLIVMATTYDLNDTGHVNLLLLLDAVVNCAKMAERIEMFLECTFIAISLISNGCGWVSDTVSARK